MHHVISLEGVFSPIALARDVIRIEVSNNRVVELIPLLAAAWLLALVLDEGVVMA